MEDKVIAHNLILEEKNRLSISGVTDVDTFDESKIILYTQDDTLEIEGEDLHIQKLSVSDGEMLIEGEISAIVYTGRNSYGTNGKGFFKRIFK
ncbi:MAG: sporulation protein YabP [Clostridia bacterium]|nr:sporulation protein YabP [Clostridia bacterium]